MRLLRGRRLVDDESEAVMVQSGKWGGLAEVGGWRADLRDVDMMWMWAVGGSGAGGSVRHPKFPAISITCNCEYIFL
jgi:hypothetical protein